MANEDAVKWLENLKQDIGKPQHSELWHYEQALVEIGELLKEQQKIIDRYHQADTFLEAHGWKWKDSE